MSVQTGVERHEPPPSKRLADRLRHRWRRLRDEPNPIWLREMRQASRVLTTPVALAVVTIGVALLIGMIGGLMRLSSQSPASVGATVFQLFFSFAYFVVVFIGSALGANAIASERDSRTWEALLLTGLQPQSIARGKFGSALSRIGLYVAALAPVGALPFLYGGVTPLEVLYAFILLLGIAVQAVAFGVALSARVQSHRGATVLTLFCVAPLSVIVFLVLGFWAQHQAALRWSELRNVGPFWLPLAYGVEPVDLDFLNYLVFLPAAYFVIPTWFFYEVTLANLSSPSEDSSYGMKRWFIATSIVFAALLRLNISRASIGLLLNRHAAFVVAYFAFAMFAVLVFAEEPLGPSRRVERRLVGASRLRRWLAPGLVPTTRLLRLLGEVPLVLVTLLFLVHLAVTPPPLSTRAAAAELLFDRLIVGVRGLYLVAFFEFFVGVWASLRMRTPGAVGVRGLLLIVAFACVGGPWLVAGILGILGEASGSAIVVAAPSPLYPFFVLRDSSEFLRSGRWFEQPKLIAPIVGALGYLSVGIAMRLAASRRCEEAITAHRALLADADRRLAEEDAQARAARACSAELSSQPEGRVGESSNGEGMVEGDSSDAAPLDSEPKATEETGQEP